MVLVPVMYSPSTSPSRLRLVCCLLLTTFSAHLSLAKAAFPETIEADGEGPWYNSQWLGSFVAKEEYGGWIWHEGFRYLYAGEVTEGRQMWLYAFDLDQWIYTHKALFPYFWVYEEGWNYYTLSEDWVGQRFDYKFGENYRIAPPEHPFLFFSAEDIPALRERMRDPAFGARYDRLIAAADRLLTRSPATGSRPNQGNSGILAFAWIVTGNIDYAERAIEEALASAAVGQWPGDYLWNRGADLVSSERCTGAAMVYDWCYDVMTAEERSTLRNAMIAEGIIPYLSSIDEDPGLTWWANHKLNNWRGVCHGGSNLAALVLYNESSLARRAARSGYAHIHDTLLTLVLEDSGGHEGVTYNNYGVEYALFAAAAHHRFFGGFEGLFLELGDERLGAYWDAYMLGPDLRMANIGRHNYNWQAGLWSETGAPEGGPSSIRSALFDSWIPGGDQLLRWSADNGGQRFYWQAASPFYFIWRRDAPSLYQAAKPELQDAVLFRGAGHAILRSEDLFLAYSGGAAHNRGDIGGFILARDDERLVDFEPSLDNLDSRFQPTLLVDGEGQSRGGPPPRGEFLKFGSGTEFHYLASDIQALYGDTPLTRAVRHLIMVRGKYIVLLDDLAASRPVTFEQRFQARFPVEASPEGGTVFGDRYDLHIRSGGFDAFTFARGSASVMNFVSLSREDEEAVLLTVLYPAASGGAPPTITVDGGTVRIDDTFATDVLTFAETNDRWQLESVNGESATAIGPPVERTLLPLREEREDSEVPSWMKARVR